MLKIYLTDLQSYNEGDLVGRWVNLPMDDDELSQALSEILKDGELVSGSDNHEEYFITDYEWDEFEFKTVSEYENIHTLNTSLQELEPLQEDELQSVEFLLQHSLVQTISEAIEQLDRVIIYQEQTMNDIAYDFIEECYEIDKLPSIIANNINYEAIANELIMDGTYYEYGSNIFQYTN